MIYLTCVLCDTPLVHHLITVSIPGMSDLDDLSDYMCKVCKGWSQRSGI